MMVSDRRCYFSQPRNCPLNTEYDQHNVIIFWGRIWDRDDDYFLVIIANINDHSAVWSLAMVGDISLEKEVQFLTHVVGLVFGLRSKICIIANINYPVMAAFDCYSTIYHGSIVITPTTITTETIISLTHTFLMRPNHANRNINM